MAEVAIAKSFEAGEIIEIACEEFKKRCANLSPLSGGKEYASFALEFQVKIRLLRAGEEDTQTRETLAWGSAGGGEEIAPTAEAETAEVIDSYKSLEPNAERVARDMPLTVEMGDGRGGRVTKKVRVKG